MKKLLSILLILALICVPLAACGGEDSPGGGSGEGGGGGGGDVPHSGDVTLTLWGGEEDQVMLKARADAFKALHADEVNLTIIIGVESESSAKDTILIDPQAAADVFAFPDDQIMELYIAGVLQEVLINANEIKAANLQVSVNAATVDGKLMAYPLTADNGYIMFYDSTYFTEDDVKTFDGMLAVAEAAGKKVAMQMGQWSAWYNIGFFRGAGFDAWLADDGVSTVTNINEAGGTNVVQAMLDIAKHAGFSSMVDDEFVTGINDGSVIAGISGPWNSNNARSAWGENYAAAKLPTFTLAGAQVQMGGVLGCKLIGVNSFSENAGWAMRLAEFLTNYESQVIRFEERAQGPTNIQASNSPEVQSDPSLAAIAIQSQFSSIFMPGGNYWGPMETLGEIIVQGNPDGVDLQTLLDNAVAGMS